jgi:hypothetical protein
VQQWQVALEFVATADGAALLCNDGKQCYITLQRWQWPLSKFLFFVFWFFLFDNFKREKESEKERKEREL